MGSEILPATRSHAVNFAMRRFVHALFIFAGICLLNFFLFQLGPGDPVNLYFGPKTKRQNLQNMRHQIGLDQPWPEQFGRWSENVLQGDLGYSWAKHRPVADILAEAIPATLQLTGLALFLNLFLGCIAGAFAGIYSERRLGQIIDFTSLSIYSIPTFWLSLVGILVFSLKLHWLPSSQMASLFVADGFWDNALDRVRHLLLPVLVLGLGGAAATARYVRANLRQVLQQDFIRLARAKGLRKRRIYLQHALRNALIPVATLLGLYLPLLLGGAFVVEVIFAWPGMGRVTYEAVFAKDYPVIMAVNLIAATMVILGNFVSDLLYQWLDPRLRLD